MRKQSQREREGEGEERRCWDNKKGKYKAKATEERKRVAIARNPSGVLNLHLGMSTPIFSFAISGDGTAFATSTSESSTIAKPISLVCVPLLCTIHPFFLLYFSQHSFSLSLRSCSSLGLLLSIRSSLVSLTRLADTVLGEWPLFCLHSAESPLHYSHDRIL